MLFEQVTRLDNQEMVLGWQLITHPGKKCTSACVLGLGQEQACLNAVLTAAPLVIRGARPCSGSHLSSMLTGLK